MAAIGVGTKYQVAINGQGYVLPANGYAKKDAPVFIPRFGTGEEGLGDLSLFKTWDQLDYSGGHFQDNYVDDPTKYSQIKNMYYDRFDNVLRPVVTPSLPSMASYTSWDPASTVPWVIFRGGLYFAGNGMGSVASGYGALLNISPSTGAIATTKADFSGAITGLAVKDDILYVAMGLTGFAKWDGTTWTVTTVTKPNLIIPFRSDRLLATGGDGTYGSYLQSFTGTDITTGMVALGTVGEKYLTILSMKEFNGRVYLGKPDGLFVYDGVQIQSLVSLPGNVSGENFKLLAVYNGILYYVHRHCIYSFNGSTIEKIKDFYKSEYVKDMQVANGRLWVLTKALKTVAGKYTATDGLLYYFDGQGWYLYEATTATSTFDSPIAVMAYPDFSTWESLFQIWENTTNKAQLRWHKTYYEDIAAASNVGEVLSPIFDANLSNVDKYFESFIQTYENIAVNDTIVVSFRTFNNNAWSAFQTLGTITSTSTNGLLKRFTTAYAGTFRKIQFKTVVTRTSTSDLVLKSQSTSYYLAPDQQWQWTLTLQTMGSTGVPLVLADKTNESTSAVALRDNIYQARQTDAPIGFEDIDFTLLNGAINNSVTTITVDSTKGFRTAGMIKIDDEIIAYTGRTATTFTGCTRAYLSTSAASHSDNAVVNAYYRVVVKEIVNERVITPNQLDTGSESQITVVLQEAPA